MLGQFFAAARSRRRAIDALVCQVAEASVKTVCTLVAERWRRWGPDARLYPRPRQLRNSSASASDSEPSSRR
jgi:hypothetical protein